MSDQVAGKTFVKTGSVAELTMFEAEADGLAELRAAGEIRVPAVVDVGLRERYSFIELEFLDLERPGRKDNEMLGRQLARLHGHTQDRYGWFRDNTIGQTLQRNVQSDDWVEFFARYRLRFQLELAAERGHGGELADLGHCLLDRLPVYFEGYTPVASLLHGDLWGGNWGSVRGEPVVFDPAVYYGDRESDIAMTMLFGGYTQAFYDAYETVWPMAPGNEGRIQLYQLYHVLNHLNLFGPGYRQQALKLIRELLV